jgi:hypothetical protein
LRNKGFTAKEIASHLGCSEHFVYKFARRTNNGFRRKYSTISDEDLRSRISGIHEQFPYSGSIVSTDVKLSSKLAIYALPIIISQHHRNHIFMYVRFRLRVSVQCCYIGQGLLHTC